MNDPDIKVSCHALKMWTHENPVFLNCWTINKSLPLSLLGSYFIHTVTGKFPISLRIEDSHLVWLDCWGGLTGCSYLEPHPGKPFKSHSKMNEWTEKGHISSSTRDVIDHCKLRYSWSSCETKNYQQDKYYLTANSSFLEFSNNGYLG